MDTQRLILFLVFSFSLLFLWEASAEKHRQPAAAEGRASVADRGGAPGAGQKPADVPAASRPAAGTASPSTPAPIRGPRARPPCPAARPRRLPAQKAPDGQDRSLHGQDRSGRRRGRRGRAQQASGCDQRAKPYLVLQRSGTRTSIARAGLLGEGLPNHRTTWRLPGPRELPAGAVLRREARYHQATEAKWSTLTFHRGSYQIDVAFGVSRMREKAPLAPPPLPVDPRHHDGPSAELIDTMLIYERFVYNETDKFKKVEFGEIDKLACRREAQAALHREDRDNGWVGIIEHYFVTASLPTRQAGPREFYTASSTRTSTPSASSCPFRRSRRVAGTVEAPLRRATGQDMIDGDRARPRPRRRLRVAHRDRRAAVLAPRSGCTA